MIKDPTEMRKATESWEVVRQQRNTVARHLMIMASGGVYGPKFRDMIFSLLLIAAYSVLEDVLEVLRDEGAFSSGDGMKRLMKASRAAIPWQDYEKVTRGQKARNDAAHARTYPDNALARDFIASVERELHAWGIVDAMHFDW